MISCFPLQHPAHMYFLFNGVRKEYINNDHDKIAILIDFQPFTNKNVEL